MYFDKAMAALPPRGFCRGMLHSMCGPVLPAYLVSSVVRDILQRIPLVQAQVRGFIAKRITADRMYAVILIQAVIWSHLSRIYVTKMRAAAMMQGIVRGVLARKLAAQRRGAATVIQAIWRSFATRLICQMDYVDIIVVQSIVRRWLCSRRRHQLIRESHDAAAVKIQSAWRGFQDYTNYIFAMADIIFVEHNIRTACSTNVASQSESWSFTVAKPRAGSPRTQGQERNKNSVCLAASISSNVFRRTAC